MLRFGRVLAFFFLNLCMQIALAQPLPPDETDGPPLIAPLIDNLLLLIVPLLIYFVWKNKSFITNSKNDSNNKDITDD